MGKTTRRAQAIILSLLMAVQTPAMAGELVAEEEILQEETAAGEILDGTTIEEELTEEGTAEEQISEEAEEAVWEEELPDGELLEDPAEDSLIPEEILEEAPASENIETITGEIAGEQSDADLIDAEDTFMFEENEPALVGEASGQCGDNAFWTLGSDGVLTISGTGEMWSWDYDFDIEDYNTPWRESRETIKKVSIGAGITSIEGYAFYRCSSITDVTIPDSVMSLGNGAFYGCSALTGMNIGDSVTSIGDWIFYNCSALTDVTIGSNVTSIGEYAFCNCNSLKSVEIPGSVTGIGLAAFEECSSLTNVNIPESVTAIEAHLFYNCSALKSVTIPKNVTKIGLKAFYNCGSLATVTFEGDAPEIKGDAFTDTTTTAYYPAGNSTWTSSVKKNYGGNITWASTDEAPAKCGDNAFWKFDGDGTLTVFGTGDMWEWKWDSTKEDYDIPWLDLKGKIKKVFIESGVTNIESFSFEGCSALTSVTIADTVTSIGNGAFWDCMVLTDVTIPDSVTSIGEKAFEGCRKLTSITIPDSVTGIPDWMFYDCRSLTDVTISNGVTSIGRSAFAYCGSLTDLIIPDSVESIGDLAFGFCSALTNITIPNSVTSIENFAFNECTALKTIKFEGNAPDFPFNSMNDDQSQAFWNVTAVAYYPVENPTWTEDVRQNYGGNITWVCFSDVTDPSAFYFYPVYEAAGLGITKGYSDHTFRPVDFCNRAAVVVFLWRLAGKPDMGSTKVFSDMTGNEEFDKAITWAYETGIATGYDDGTFRPWAKCHRAAALTFLWRYAGKPQPETVAGFSDMTKNTDFDKAISWAAENDITTGWDDGTFRPWDQCLRLAVVSFLYRYVHL